MTTSGQHRSDGGQSAAMDLVYAISTVGTALASVLSLLRAKGVVSDEDLRGMFDGMAAGGQNAGCSAEATAADLRELDVALAVIGQLRGHLKV